VKRAAYFALGLLAAALGIGVVLTQHAAWWQLVVFAMAPDLALFAGAGQGLERGQLHPRAVPLYNAVHRFWAPGVLAAVALALMSWAWLAGGLAWIAHIAFDRSLGFGLRTREGFQRS
jgi:hypothetical protein